MWHTVARLDELSPNQRKLCEVAGRRIALFFHNEQWIAIDNHCPHKGGPVGAGPLSDGELTCPWHGLQFDLASGKCREPSTFCLTRLDVRVLGGEMQVLLTELAATREAAPIFRYLVRYGKPGHVGRFGAIEQIAAERGARVLVQTDRGMECGEVLVTAADFDPRDTRSPAGELLRLLSAEELTEHGARSETLLATCAEQLRNLPSAVLDGELTFDGQTLILYHAGEPTATLGPLAAKLAETIGVPRVQFETLASEQARTTAAAGATNDMRGPYERLKYDFRRVWECPACHHRERTAGTVTSLICACQGKEDMLKRQPMKLIDDGPRRTDGLPMPKRSALP